MLTRLNSVIADVKQHNTDDKPEVEVKDFTKYLSVLVDTMNTNLDVLEKLLAGLGAPITVLKRED